MTVAETRRAAKLVVLVNVEVTGLTPVATFALDVLFTKTISSIGITSGRIIVRSFPQTAAFLAAKISEIPEVCVTPVALWSCHARLASALTVFGALEVHGADGIAVACLARDPAEDVGLRREEMVGETPLAVGAVSESLAVHALASTAGFPVQLLVETAAVGPVVAFAGFTLVGLL